MEISKKIDSAGLSSKFVETPEGYLQGTAVVTNIGVFTYMNADGSMRKEARKQEDVFNPSHLDSMLGKPITMEHPGEMVTSDNVDQYIVGMTGSYYSIDGVYVSLPLTITNKDAVDAIKSGKLRALSLGYTSIDIPNDTNDVYLGMTYDVTQTNMQVNHLSLVPQGRAGSQAVIRMDGASVPITINQETPKENNMAEPVLKTVHLDGMDFQAEERVVVALTAAKEALAESSKKLDAVESEKAKVDAELDQLRQKVDGLVADIAEKDEQMKGMVSKADVAVLAKKRADIEAIATQCKIELKADMDDEAIMKAVILSVDPSVEQKLDNAVYVEARYDGIVADMKKTSKEDAEVRGVGAGLDSGELGEYVAPSATSVKGKLDAWISGASKRAKE